MTPLALVTVAHGEHEALAAQIWALRRQSVLPDLHVVVALDDPELEWALGEHTAALDLPWEVEVVKVPASGDRGLPYATAYNAGVVTALESGAEIVALLDATCTPMPGFVEGHARILGPRVLAGTERPVLDCGPVHVLEPGRTVPPPHEWTSTMLRAGTSGRPGGAARRRSSSLRTAWSRAFATTATSWTSVGGFDDGYLGHAGEDLDLGERFAAASGTVLWTEDAAVLQRGDDDSAPQTRDLVDNANRFARRWGRLPFEQRLTELEEMGMVARADDGSLVTTSDPAPVG